MGFSKSAVSRARGRLAQMKDERESLAAARLREVYEKLPRVREIDMQLRRTMVTAAQAVFSQGLDAQDHMAKAKEENLALQKERQVLIAAHFPEGFLNEEPVCRLCGGMGYLGTKMCRCLEQLCVQEQQAELGSAAGCAGHFDAFRLDYYPENPDPRSGIRPRALMEKNLRFCREYAIHFQDGAPNLLFNGGTGLGKTFLAVCIAKAVTAKGFSVVYESAINLFGILERAKFSPSEENRLAAEKLEKCDLLIIDDLGTELPGQFVTSALYGLMNQRLLGGKSMIITTNLNVSDAGERYSPQIASRLYGEFKLLPFLGQDIRVMKRKGM